MNKKLYSIKTTCEKTGLNEFLLRAWENRYSAIVPERTETNRRLYSENDIQRLILLKKVTENGLNIGSIAKLSNDELENILNRNADEFESIPDAEPESISPESLIKSSIEAILDLDSQKLDSILNHSILAYSQPVMVEKFITPLVQEIGDLWKNGVFRITHEHLASQSIKNFLFNTVRSCKCDKNSPILTIATPAGQRHEIGALIGAVVASAHGWKTLFVGSDLPAQEIAYSVIKTGSKAVFLSLVYPEDDWQLNDELKMLRNLIGFKIPIIISGRCVKSYQKTIDEIKAKVVYDTASLKETLIMVRN